MYYKSRCTKPQISLHVLHFILYDFNIFFFQWPKPDVEIWPLTSDNDDLTSKSQTSEIH